MKSAGYILNLTIQNVEIWSFLIHKGRVRVIVRTSCTVRWDSMFGCNNNYGRNCSQKRKCQPKCFIYKFRELKTYIFQLVDNF